MYNLSQMLLGLAVMIGVSILGVVSGGCGKDGQRKGKGGLTLAEESASLCVEV